MATNLRQASVQRTRMEVAVTLNGHPIAIIGLAPKYPFDIVDIFQRQAYSCDKKRKQFVLPLLGVIAVKEIA